MPGTSCPAPAAAACRISVDPPGNRSKFAAPATAISPGRSRTTVNPQVYLGTLHDRRGRKVLSADSWMKEEFEAISGIPSLQRPGLCAGRVGLSGFWRGCGPERIRIARPPEQDPARFAGSGAGLPKAGSKALSKKRRPECRPPLNRQEAQASRARQSRPVSTRPWKMLNGQGSHRQTRWRDCHRLL